MSVYKVQFTETKQPGHHPLASLMDQGISQASSPDILGAEESPPSKDLVRPPAKKQQDGVRLALEEHLNTYRKQTSTGCFYFLIASKWWQDWLIYVTNGGEIPEAIDNLPIVSSTQPGLDAVFTLTPNATVEYATMIAGGHKPDCYAVPVVVWKALSSWFGGGPPIVYRGIFVQDGEKIELDIFRTISYPPSEVESSPANSSVAPNGTSPEANSSSASPPSAGGHCFVCGELARSICSRCRHVHYCSALCQKSHWSYHKNWCSKERDTLLGRRGTTGLLNIGNSCYLNSSLQCLVHCQPLIAYLLSDRYLPHLNPSNRDASKNNLLVKEFCRLAKDMWFDTKSLHSPERVKSVLGTISRDYSGNLQQDAHDALELLLDRIHEDVNRVLLKPFVEQPEGDGGNDREIGLDAWEKHQLRHKSIITELFGGQLKSKVQCCSESCSRVSVTFDYFNTLQLAIPGPMSHVMVLYAPYIKGIGGVADIKNNKKLLQIVLEDLPQGSSASILVVKQMLVETINKHHSMGAGGESKELSDLLTVSDLKVVTFDTRTMTIEALCEDEDNIKRCTGEGILNLVAFYSDPKLNRNAVLLQKKIVSRLSYFGSVVNSATHEVIGLPLFLSFDNSWSCSRVRYLVWQQVSRFIHPDIIAIINEEPSEIFKRNTAMSHLLRIFMSKGNGDELKYNPGPIKHTIQDTCPSWIARHPILSQIWHTHHNETARERHNAATLRSMAKEIPDSMELAIGDFVGTSDIPYVCVRWDKAWNSVLVDKAFDFVPLEDCGTHEDHKSTSDSVSLYKCLRMFTKQEFLKGDNAWYCRMCKGHVTAKKELQLWTLPKVLIIGLKRFATRGGGEFTQGALYRSKIDDFVDFPINGLDLTEFCESSSGERKESLVYDLFGVCNHFGRMGFGHYTSYVREWTVNGQLSSKWYKCDDDSVSACSENDVKSKAAYILFYVRR